MSDDLDNRLSSVRPEADPKFQQQLEDRLIAAMMERNQRKMNANGHLKHLPLPPEVIPLRPSRPINLTLAATLAIFIAVGTLIALLMNGGFTPLETGQQPVPTEPPLASPTPTLLPTLLPVDAPQDYVVEAGDTCESILLKHGHQAISALTEFYRLNNMATCDIFPGMVVKVPYPSNMLNDGQIIAPPRTPNPADIDPGIIVDPNWDATPPAYFDNGIAVPDPNNPGLYQIVTPAPVTIPSQPPLIPTVLPTVVPPVQPTLAPEILADALFSYNGIALLHYSLETQGNTLILYHILATFTHPYKGFIQLETPDGELVASHDFTPTAGLNGLLEPSVAQTVVVPLPGHLPSGEYLVRLGLYDEVSGERVPVIDHTGELVDETAAPLGTITLASNDCSEGQTPVVTTTRDLLRGTFLQAADLSVACWQTAPDGAATSLDEVVNQILEVDLRAYAPVITRYADGVTMAEQDDQAEVVRLQPGDVAITVPLNNRDQFYGLQAGDRINISFIVHMLKSEESGCTEPGDTCALASADDENAIPLYSDLFKNLEVLEVGWVPLSSDQRGLGMITVAVPHQDTIVLEWVIDAQLPLIIEHVMPNGALATSENATTFSNPPTEAELEQCLADDPENVFCLSWMGGMKFFEQPPNYEEAIVYLERAIEAGARDPYDWWQLGRAYYWTGDCEKAIPVLQEGAQIAAQSEPDAWWFIEENPTGFADALRDCGVTLED